MAVANGWKPLGIDTKCSILDVAEILDLPQPSSKIIFVSESYKNLTLTLLMYGNKTLEISLPLSNWNYNAYSELNFLFVNENIAVKATNIFK